MKLRAILVRTNDRLGKSLKATFPKDSINTHMWESILKRNLGARPYSEASFMNNDGTRVRIWFK